MKYLSLARNLLTLVLLGVIAACSSENAIVGNIRVSDVVTSDCKTSVSETDIRPERLTGFCSTETTLSLLIRNGNTIVVQFLDVMDNYVICQLNVDMTCVENKVMIILYPDCDILANCVYMYDVNFRVRNLFLGSYQLEIFQTITSRQTTSSNRIYHGTVTSDFNKTVRLVMTH